MYVENPEALPIGIMSITYITSAIFLFSLYCSDINYFSNFSQNSWNITYFILNSVHEFQCWKSWSHVVLGSNLATCILVSPGPVLFFALILHSFLLCLPLQSTYYHDGSTNTNESVTFVLNSVLPFVTYQRQYEITEAFSSQRIHHPNIILSSV